MRFIMISIMSLIFSASTLVGAFVPNRSNYIMPHCHLISEDMMLPVKREMQLYGFIGNIMHKTPIKKNKTHSVDVFDLVQSKDDVDFMDFLQEQDGNLGYLRLRNKYKKSLLEWSIIHKKENIAYMLALQSADQDLVGRFDQDGNNIAHLATHDGVSTIFDALEEKTHSWHMREKNNFIMKIIKHKNKMNETPLFNAIRSNDQKSVRYLLRYYNAADLNSPNKWGQTALIVAALYQRNDVAQLLIEKGADTTIKGLDGHSFTDICKQNILIV